MKKKIMKKKIIALDMDGTLLDREKQVSQENLEALGRLMDNGHIVCISTGRALPGVEKYMDIIRPNGPVITNNGAILVDPGIRMAFGNEEAPLLSDDKMNSAACLQGVSAYSRDNARVLSETGLEYEDAVKILTWGEYYDVTMIIWCRFELFGNRMDELLKDYGRRFGGSIPKLYFEAETQGDGTFVQYTGAETQGDGTFVQYTGAKTQSPGRQAGQNKDAEEYSDCNEREQAFEAARIRKKYAGVLAKGITKILWYASEERISELSPGVDESELHCVTKCTSDPDFLEFFNKKVSKAIVLQKICDMYGMQPQDVVAMGDGTNDISMLQFAGLGIAMKNAPENVKQAADRVSLYTNEESGVARELMNMAELPC